MKCWRNKIRGYHKTGGSVLESAFINPVFLSDYMPFSELGRSGVRRERYLNKKNCN